MNKEEKIVLAWCDTGMVTGEFAFSILSNKPDNIIDILRSSGKKIATQRQEVFDIWMSSDYDHADWILWIDSDIYPSQEDINNIIKLADKDKFPVLSGLYFTLINNTPTPCSFMKDKIKKVYSKISIEDINKKDIVEVDATGFGMLLMHRSVGKRLLDAFGYKHFFLEEQDINNHSNFIGEDLMFCQHLEDISVPIHVHTGIVPKHIKSIAVDEKLYYLYNK